MHRDVSSLGNHAAEVDTNHPVDADETAARDSDTRDSDTRDTGEHFFESLVESRSDGPESSPASSARRIADLTSQIDFLNLAVLRYQELLEADRLSQARRASEAVLEADARHDELRRTEHERLQAVHESYRKLLAQQQHKFDKALSTVANAHATALADEQARHREIVEREHARRGAQLDAARAQVRDERDETHHDEVRELKREIVQTQRALDRIQEDLRAAAAGAQAASERAAIAEADLAERQRDFDAQADKAVARQADLQARLVTAERRAVAQRQRAAASLAELLERSAAMAAEADAAHEHFVAQLEAADERTHMAAQREAELEEALGALRAPLSQTPPPPRAEPDATPASP